MVITADKTKYANLREEILPVRIIKTHEVSYAEHLLEEKPAAVSFKGDRCIHFRNLGSYVILDFGKELCGGLRIITRDAKGVLKWRLTFGESLTECCAALGEKNATNDHSPRDIIVDTVMMSDLIFGQTGFRFVRLELIEGERAMLQSVFAVSFLPYFEKQAVIKTDDPLLNQIIETAVYTLKLNFQNGYIWDGVKRDRLVWCGDLHPEIITSLYLFGDNENIRNSLRFLRDTTDACEWMNFIPTYSAWWVINLCDYTNFTGDISFFEENRAYALSVIRHFNECIAQNGEMNFTGGRGMEFFLDWPTAGTKDAVIGTAALIRLMAQKFSALEENEMCREIVKKTESCITQKTTLKPVRAFQILAGRNCTDSDTALLESNGTKGFSTFMAYYILTALSRCGKDGLDLVKEYYGGMLSRGATSFWEDFDIDWLENSARIDEFPAEGQKDIHGDFGKHCYVGFRHSLCHGWSAGVVSYIIEYILGVHIENGGERVTVCPHLSGLEFIEAKLPLKNGWLEISVHGDDVKIEAPNGTYVTEALRNE